MHTVVKAAATKRRELWKLFKHGKYEKLQTILPVDMFKDLGGRKVKLSLTDSINSLMNGCTIH